MCYIILMDADPTDCSNNGTKKHWLASVFGAAGKIIFSCFPL